MNSVFEILRSNAFLMILISINIILLIVFSLVLMKLMTINKKYKRFIEKLGNGQNIQEDLENYMYKVERTEKQNSQILNKLNNMEKDIGKCIQKVGIIRYNAYKDTGSDLSFALALLDEQNDGVVLNGIYSREMSNIYAKPVENGKSNYTVSEEEQKAIQKAISADNIYRIKKDKN